MAPKQLPIWHCTAEPAFWPGCGKCGPCVELAPEVFAALGEIRKELRRCQEYSWDDEHVDPLINDLLAEMGER